MDPQLFEYLQSFLTPRRKALFKKILAQRTNHFTVVTEDVYQLHNTSAVLRSCEVFGIQNMHVIEERLGKRVDREIAMGAQKWVTTHRHSNAKDCIAKLRKEDYQIVATTPHGGTLQLQEFDVHKKSALFFGTEKEGISESILAEADCSLTIPMYGFTESLNISVSAAIILQTLVTKMRTQEIAWQLTEVAQKELEIAWTKASIKNIDAIIERYYEEKNL